MGTGRARCLLQPESNFIGATVSIHEQRVVLTIQVGQMMVKIAMLD